MSNHKLIIAEKPSVAQAIAKVLGVTGRKDGYMEGGGWLVSWCIGHLVTLAGPEQYGEHYKKWALSDLPIAPEHWKLVVAPDKGKQFATLKSLMSRKDVSGLVCATDAGREGELIFRYVYELAGCDKPFERLWISSMEDSAIQEGFAALKDGREYDRLHWAAQCRARADWLAGMNLSRLFSLVYGGNLNVGRVQSPTLAMLAERDTAIGQFKKQPFYKVSLSLGNFGAVSERMDDRKAADGLAAACGGQSAVVQSLEQKEKTEQPPRLYDLTTLQREANRLFGYTAEQTLSYTQSLYEKKLVTYPRTDSRFLTEDMRDSAGRVVSLVLQIFSAYSGMELSPDLGRVLDNSKVSDHHAIIPTAALSAKGMEGLTDGESLTLALIACKLLCAVAEPHRYKTTKAVLSCAGGEFTAQGKVVTAPGWKEIEQRFRDFVKQKQEEGGGPEHGALPPLSDGQTFDGVAASVTEHETTPPKPYTEDTLLSAMERAGREDCPDDLEGYTGIGTPATRAGIIENLVKRGYLERKGRSLCTTAKGINLITILPDSVRSPALTAEWEGKLQMVERGELSPDSFTAEISGLIAELVEQYKGVEADKTLFQPEREAIAPCPRCGKNVVELVKGFVCEDRACGFALWKKNRFFEKAKKELTKKIAVDLLTKGRCKMKGLYSEKTGKTYDATLVLDDSGKYVGFKLEF